MATAETSNEVGNRTMRATAIQEFGASPAVVDVQLPEPAAREVRVRVHAASINGFDLMVAAGNLEGMMEHRFPVVIGKDFAGVVDAVGDKVTEFEVGDRVFGVVTKPFLGDGSLGEYVTVPKDIGIAQIPAGIEMEQAAALGLAGATALQAVEAIAPVAGETVLISGATGGVGAFAIQMVAALGADVIATVKDEEDADFVRSMGATHIANYTDDIATTVHEIRPEGVDAVLHFAGDGAQYADLLLPGGRMASAVGFGPEQAGARDIQVTGISTSAIKARLSNLAQEVTAGRLRVPIARVYTLDEAPQALKDFSSGKNGKIVVSMV